MPLDGIELALVANRALQIADTIAAARDASWPERAEAAATQLEAIHGDWWIRYDEKPDAYANDIARFNELAGWVGDHAQVPSVARGGLQSLTPPKFFGGNARVLSEKFVLCVSLNHALPANSAYLDELRDFQTRATSLRAHRDYFTRPYAYARFFVPRAKLLAAYAQSRGSDADPADWRTVNAKYALYVERYPTMSRSCAMTGVDPALLERQVFVMALNALAHRVVLDLLRPRAVLLAGRATWPLFPTNAPRGASERIRPRGLHACPVTVDGVPGVDGVETRVIRCNFLRTVNGPNSDAELEALGQLLAKP